MRFEFKPDNHGVSDEELIEDLRRVAASAPASIRLTRQYYEGRGKYASSTLRKRFGGWLMTLRKAGIEATRTYRISDEELFRNLESVWLHLGRQPSSKGFGPPLSRFGQAAYCRRFGSWQKALKAFVEAVGTGGEDEVVSASRVIASPRSPREPGWRLRFVVMRRDNFRCCKCGRSPSMHPGLVLHLDHVVPWTKGGQTVEANLQTLCEECNIGKSDLSDTT